MAADVIINLQCSHSVLSKPTLFILIYLLKSKRCLSLKKGLVMAIAQKIRLSYSTINLVFAVSFCNDNVSQMIKCFYFFSHSNTKFSVGVLHYQNVYVYFFKVYTDLRTLQGLAKFYTFLLQMLLKCNKICKSYPVI